MAGKVQEAKLDSRKSRKELERVDRRTHWRALPSSSSGRFHLGYERGPEDKEGRWILRKYQSGKYSITPLGLADDARDADGDGVLDFEQAYARARARLERPLTSARMTVRQAMQSYIDHKRALGQPVGDTESRERAHILPTLGDVRVAELTSEQLRKWLAGLATMPRMIRSKRDGKQRYTPAPVTDDARRARKASANRIWTVLRAALNHAFNDSKVPSDIEWRKVKPFKGVGRARLRYLTVAEAKRLINSCDPEFRKLVQAALQTGGRYGQLAQLVASDFNPDSKTLRLRTRKGDGTEKVFHATLTEEGAQLFTELCAGRAGSALIFQHLERKQRRKGTDDHKWRPSEQDRPMADACKHANIKPPIGFHILRHTWASHAVMNGVPLLVVAKNLGHSDTRMVELHYGHLAPSYITDALRAGAPNFGFKPGPVTALVPKGAR